jgi:mRNA interferase RelE/StbE
VAEPPPWRVTLAPSADRDLKALTPDVRERISEAIDGLVGQSGDVRKLKGRPAEYRLRVGDYRVLFERQTDSRVVLVHRIAHRREAYR